MRCARPGSSWLQKVLWVFPALTVGLTLMAATAEVNAQDSSDRVASATAGAPRIPPGLNFANALLNQRRYELAAEEYEKFLRDHPDGPNTADALYGMARAKLFLLRYSEARQYLEAFLEKAPNHPSAPTAQFRLGEAAYLQQDLESARRDLETFVQSYPEHPHLDAAWPYLGDVRFALNDFAGAREAYEKGLSQFPEGPLADRSRYYLARVLVNQGEPDAALATLEPLITKADSPWSERARLQIGQIQTDAGDWEEALATFAAIEEANPQGGAASEARLRRAGTLIRLNRPDEAEPLLQDLANDENLPVALASQAAYDLGGLQMDLRNQTEEALRTWNDALKRFPSSAITPLLLFRSAEALQELGQAAEARERFQKMAEGFPQDSWADRALLNAAGLALEAQDFDDARALSGKLVSQHAGSSLLANAQLIESRALRAQGLVAEAIPILQGLLETEGLNPELAQAARYDLSLAYKATNQGDKATEVLDALTQNPDASMVASGAHYALGQDRFEAGQFAEAIPPLEKYLDEAPQGDLAPHALAYLADAHHRLGQEEASQNALERLARDWPESEDLVRLRVRLGEEALREGQRAERAVDLFRPVAEGPLGDFSAQARSGLGWSLVGLEKFAEAADVFSSVLEADADGPYAAEAAYMRAWSLEKADQTDDAIDAFAQAAEKNPDSPQGLRARLAQARLLAKKDQHGEAADAYAAYLAHAPAETEGLDAIRAEQGWALHDAGRLEESKGAFQTLFEQVPESSVAQTARIDLAKIAFADGSPDEATSLLEPFEDESFQADPAIVQEALYLLGRIAFDRSDWGRAREHFQRLAEDFPDGTLHDQAQFWRAEAAFHGDDPGDAELLFASLAQEVGPDSEPWRATAWMRRVQCLVALRKWSDVLAEADSLAEKLPDFPQMAEIHFARGRALQSQAAPRFEEARSAYRSAIDEAPGTELAARAEFMIGETYFFEKNVHEAERAFLAVALTYDVPALQAAALLEAGKVAETDDRPQEAAASYRKLIEQFPDDPNAEEARKRLDALAL